MQELNNQRERDTNTNTIPERKKYIAIRSSIILVGLFGIVLNSIFGYALPSTNVECIVDYTWNFTTSINNYFNDNTESRNLLLIFSNLIIDIILICLGILWILKGTSFRVFIALGSFYIFKFFIQLTFQESIPHDYLWLNPGFPSLFVSYLPSHAFFYSVPTGFLTIAICEFWKTDRKYFSYLTICVLFLDIFNRNVLRANYIIDLLSAVIIAHFIFILSDEFCNKYLDNDWITFKQEDGEIMNNLENIYLKDYTKREENNSDY